MGYFLLFLITGLAVAPGSVQAQEQKAAARLNIPLPEPSDSLQAVFGSYVPQLYEALIAERLACIEQTVPLPYHPEVFRFVKRYLIDNREQTQRFLRRAPRYFPIFEEALKRHQLPDELKYLAIIESALLPRAQSWASAVGLWQFMSFTARDYGLLIDRYIDERMDPYRSTDAACRFLKDLYQMFGDWHLALAAYNCGAGNVRRAIRRSGDKTSFWEIYPYLPRETRAYVPFYIAMVYVMHFYDAHNIAIPEDVEPYLLPDTIHAPPQTSLQLLAQELQIPLDTLKALNPHLKYNLTPPYGGPYVVYIPAHAKENYLSLQVTLPLRAEEDLIANPAPPLAARTVGYQPTGQQQATYHRVKRGETLHSIARQYGVSTDAIKHWNHLKSNTIYPQQRLIIWQKTSSSAAYHTVKVGETFWSIARRYNISTEQLQALNPQLNTERLLPGQRIRLRE